MTLLEARDSILEGRGINDISSELLKTIPYNDRGIALYWIGENLDRLILKESDSLAVEELLSVVKKVGVRNAEIEPGKIMIVLEELRELTLTEPKKNLDRLDIAGKELSAAEAMQMENAAGKALKWLDEKLANNEISQAQYDESREFIFNIALDAHQTSEAIIDELTLDFMNRQNDWDRPIGDILDEWQREQTGDEPEGPTL